MKKALFSALALGAAVACAWVWVTAGKIETQSHRDEARPADVIIVLGAAEYRGKPSPVLEARLNHALALFVKRMAPYIITTGGAGGDPWYTEGDVGRAYLSRRGVPGEAVLVEPEGESTAESVAAAVEIMRRRGFRSAIIVSDGYHIFRVKRMMQAQGFTVYGSPRPSAAPPVGWRAKWLYARQAVGYGLWRIGINI